MFISHSAFYFSFSDLGRRLVPICICIFSTLLNPLPEILSKAILARRAT